jgi:hypothetical protein
MLRCEPNEHASAKKLVAGKRELPELLVPSGYDKLDVLPSDFSYRNFDVHLSERKRPTERVVAQIYSALWAEIEARMERRPSTGATALPGSPATLAEAPDRPNEVERRGSTYPISP